jgi:molybdenum cofactor cytidylyltransferase
MSEAAAAAILLAAGQSSRLGQPKQLIRVAGETLLHRTARLALQAGCSPVLVVLGFESARMCRELQDLEVLPIENPSWPEGMGASLRTGMEALLHPLLPLPSTLLLLVCDQPRLTLPHLRRLLERHAAGEFPITASMYQKRPGVPAVFAAGLFAHLAASSGDRGARTLIRSHGSAIQTVCWPEGSLDLDSPEDLDRISPQ